MKTLIYPLLLVLVISGCAEADRKTANNIELIEKYIKAVENQDYQVMESMLGEDYRGYGPSHTDSTNREAALSAWKENIENLYESISYQKSRNIAVTLNDGPNQGNWVSNWAQLSIKYKDGRGPVVIWANTSYQIDKGKIVKSYTVYNEADVLEQLGYVFINPQDL